MLAIEIKGGECHYTSLPMRADCLLMSLRIKPNERTVRAERSGTPGEAKSRK